MTAIQLSELEFRLSWWAGNVNPNQSLWWNMSTATGWLIPTDNFNNIFDNVSGAESASGDAEYRCIYAKNANTANTLVNGYVMIGADTISPSTDIEIAVDTNNPAQVVANEATAPSWLTWQSAANAKLDIGNLAAGAAVAIWIKRTVTAGASASSDSFELIFGWETAND